MKLKPTIFVFAIWATGLCHAYASTSHEIECPTEISAAALAINAPEGWSAYAQEGLRLRSAEPALGPPEEKAFLKPGSTKSIKGGSIDSWLELSGSGPTGKWIVCRYGERGEITLSKKLHDNTSACTVSSRREQVQVSCTW
ncbi:STY0301 family protein [Pseudoduganella violacea]|uniref:Uncharacterized protein n=1 Tax=Pseudoduganella violacea TaxID=1715466 RepID=A0A7W5B7I3_9BURK|nr:STY0301 family protein [Pseudoduganella violacea]MBB3117858.1 hypothetical protein [Pseudoduganella violacea]